MEGYWNCVKQNGVIIARKLRAFAQHKTKINTKSGGFAGSLKELFVEILGVQHEELTNVL